MLVRRIAVSSEADAIMVISHLRYEFGSGSHHLRTSNEAEPRPREMDDRIISKRRFGEAVNTSMIVRTTACIPPDPPGTVVFEA